ncbi:MAG TPA: hypothetical protein PK079_05230 [Leptospiraceae bacterium]|nr:hypothetical protein [Leptospiraceae bacterium]HMW06274.1 hypothetical protein [Leptospiraceae bacterium]HMX33165.1 hypothetical protein [Leptospiraceae bacterium]HMY31736.1 hypothetical protein [Leptospiraceae bacterium]HMZ64529.1 hypothetical protein [Leptospiraceae bacterium]
MNKLFSCHIKKFCKKSFFYLVLMIHFIGCAGFYNQPQMYEKQNPNLTSKSIRLEFTGFYFYEKEKKLLKKEILESGFMEDSNSSLLLEVILEEREHTYSHRFLHFTNMVASLFTLGIIPFYTITEHSITYRYFEGKKEIAKTKQILRLDQFRGLSMLPLTFFFWPSSAFDRSILDSWKLQ